MKKTMNYSEDDLIMISALTHFSYCKRRCALIHIEQAWAENIFTVEGNILHERVHEQEGETRAGVRIERGLPLRSLRLGVIGKADLIEFHKIGKNVWQPFPVEYKRGKPKPDHCDEVQLCAQALCLEEMMGMEVPRGALFYGKTRHRHEVSFDPDLRKETEETVKKIRELLSSGETPQPVYEKRCKQCSLVDLCLPKTLGKKRSIDHYLSGALEP
ncbi:MAG: CRISPR-associated protein Cas4 [Deltaproteobacteria bacterium]|nr:CRISPR-associated protein Cas4 [Deltaproteobacteria bacterium]